MPNHQTQEQWKRVIQHRASGEYYAGQGFWTKHFAEAKLFADLALAFETAHQDGLTGCCVVVFRMGRKEFDAQFLI